MAGKGRRAASRQGQLKRKRVQKGPSGIPTTRRTTAVDGGEQPVGITAGVEDAELEGAAEAAMPAEAPVAAPRTRRPSTVARTPHGEFSGAGQQGRLRGERPAAYLFAGAEFRRIMVLTSVIVAALIVLGIVL
ncbi:MAG: hypothetical protein O3A93_00700 [Chloroflexi bacterium]|nr:hypothetical protein [Chloroflexota bacterium]MDA1269767.1 hypothetical protein [Chloroflexota bacterium]PKB59096.1 MAG: hypothetical protein BZY83_03740 [SAR202 cluster bacterium Casp-Chloro-G2]